MSAAAHNIPLEYSTSAASSRAPARGHYSARHFHEEWLGLVQPSEGLLLSIPVLIEADIMVRRRDAELAHRFVELCAEVEIAAPDPRTRKSTPAKKASPAFDASLQLRDLDGLFQKILQIPGDYLEQGDQIPPALELAVQDGQQLLRPSFAILRPPMPEPALEDDETPESDPRALNEDELHPASQAGLRYEVLGWDIDPSLDLDKAETSTGDWHFPPAAKFERLMRHARVPIGLLTNRREIRLIYAPHGEAAGSVTFRVPDMVRPTGRPILDALVMLLGQKRLLSDAPECRLPALLRQSRSYQANVTEALAKQLFEGLTILLRGFERAALRDGIEVGAEGDVHPAGAAAAANDDGSAAQQVADYDAGKTDPAHLEANDELYQGLLTVLLRLVFALYAEDRKLLPIDHPHYAAHLSVMGLYEQLLEDSGRYPDSMDSRFGAWDRLLALFRAIYLGADHGDLHLSPRNGDLFDPHTFAFLEGWPEQPSPSIDDATVFALLQRLLILDGQRLSYRSLDVEQIGSVYEALMGYHVQKLKAPARCLRPKSVWLSTEAILAQKPAQRGKWIKTETGLSKAQADKIAKASQAGLDPLREALDRFAVKGSSWAQAGRYVIQPGAERRRTSSHYTPRELSEPIVEKTLRPLIATLGDQASSEQILRLKVCDPAMGSGAFLVAACRYLADQVVSAWEREGSCAAIQTEFGEPVAYARRLVAQRCLYGVDKNPYAVQLAKLSLWLVTMGKELPLTFVDHALRCGDSLVGLDLRQICSFHWKEGIEARPMIAKAVEEAVAAGLKLRKEILGLAGSGSHLDHERKRRLLWDASDAMERVRLIGDLVVGAFFSASRDRAREDERVRRLALVEAWLTEDGVVPGELKALQRDLVEGDGVLPFHWGVEFLEVFYAGRRDVLAGDVAGEGARMDAVVGNPPFAGKNSLADARGPTYPVYLKAIHKGAHGNSDLSAHFFRRADALLGEHGTAGLIATNTICQGDTRASGLQPMVNGGYVIYDAKKSMVWPGDAAVNVSVVHMAKGETVEAAKGKVVMDGAPVVVINSRLRPKPERPDPRPLPENKGLAYQGSIILGMGFVLTPEERERLVDKDPRNDERIFPYIGGKEVNTSPTQSHSRYVINFGDMSLEEAGEWPDLLDIVRRKVKPERDKNKRECRRKYWWRFGETTPALYNALKKSERCLVISCVTKHICFSFQPTDRVFSHKLVVVPEGNLETFAVLQSQVHEFWVRALCSTLGATVNYSPSDCLTSFPFPRPDYTSNNRILAKSGEKLELARLSYLQNNNCGLTEAYNDLSDPTAKKKELMFLREAHQLNETIVLSQYDIHPQNQVRNTKSKNNENSNSDTLFKETVIDKLFQLNAKRAQLREK